MKIKKHTANNVNNMLCDVKFWFDSISIQSLGINLQRYRTYRCTNKFIGTNCMSLLIYSNTKQISIYVSIDLKFSSQTMYQHPSNQGKSPVLQDQQMQPLIVNQQRTHVCLTSGMIHVNFITLLIGIKVGMDCNLVG